MLLDSIVSFGFGCVFVFVGNLVGYVGVVKCGVGWGEWMGLHGFQVVVDELGQEVES